MGTWFGVAVAYNHSVVQSIDWRDSSVEGFSRRRASGYALHCPGGRPHRHLISNWRAFCDDGWTGQSLFISSSTSSALASTLPLVGSLSSRPYRLLPAHIHFSCQVNLWTDQRDHPPIGTAVGRSPGHTKRSTIHVAFSPTLVENDN